MMKRKKQMIIILLVLALGVLLTGCESADRAREDRQRHESFMQNQQFHEEKALEQIKADREVAKAEAKAAAAARAEIERAREAEKTERERIRAEAEKEVALAQQLAAEAEQARLTAELARIQAEKELALTREQNLAREQAYYNWTTFLAYVLEPEPRKGDLGAAILGAVAAIVVIFVLRWKFDL